MSLYESGDSTGEVSITDMFNNKRITSKLRNISLEEIALFSVRGGWPENVKVKPKFMCVITGNTKDTNIDIETGIYVVPLTTLKS